MTEYRIDCTCGKLTDPKACPIHNQPTGGFVGGVGSMPMPFVPTTDDPWKHRSTGMRCMSCMWFVLKGDPMRKMPASGHALGRCRRHSPLAGGGGWPAVFTDDFCGDHKLDEAKV